jgi:hypothetical protein
MEDWQKAIKLQEFIKFHIPKGYREAIGKFSYVPSVNESDYAVFENAYKNGTLPDCLKSYKRRPLFGIVDFPFDMPYIIDAIQTYFDKEHNNGTKV